MSEIKSLYMHIPFCRYICSYCDFPKRLVKNQNIDLYVINIIEEIKLTTKEKSKLETIYIGGGTPLTLTEIQLEKLLAFVNEYFDLVNLKEFTIESNPGDLTKEKLEILKKYKLNRISIGVQSLDDKVLNEVGRKTSTKELIETIELAKNYFINISCDFIYNLPLQTTEDIEKIFTFLIKYKINHFSWYSLIFEEQTILARKNYHYWSEEKEARIYQEIQNFAKKNGYINYEISNFAKPGFQSKHNQVYWQYKEYYGVGLGAASFLSEVRATNTRSLTTYNKIITEGIKELKTIDERSELDKESEKLMLALRTNEGLKASNSFFDQLDFTDQYFLKDHNSVRLKEEYYFLSNDIIVDKLLELEELYDKN